MRRQLVELREFALRSRIMADLHPDPTRSHVRSGTTQPTGTQSNIREITTSDEAVITSFALQLE